MEYQKSFEQRFPNQTRFDKTSIQLTSQLQITRNELQEAASEIASLRVLIEEMYKQALSNVNGITQLLTETNTRAPFRNIPQPKNQEGISYGQQAGYAQYAAAFYQYTTKQLIERLLDTQTDLEMMASSVQKLTINKSTIERSPGISLPDLADDISTTKSMKAVAAAVASKPQSEGKLPKSSGGK